MVDVVFDVFHNRRVRDRVERLWGDETVNRVWPDARLIRTESQQESCRPSSCLTIT